MAARAMAAPEDEPALAAMSLGYSTLCTLRTSSFGSKGLMR
jgi:hypothetical protein